MFPILYINHSYIILYKHEDKISWFSYTANVNRKTVDSAGFEPTPSGTPVRRFTSWAIELLGTAGSFNPTYVLSRTCYWLTWTKIKLTKWELSLQITGRNLHKYFDLHKYVVEESAFNCMFPWKPFGNRKHKKS